ncbi:MAG: hypothetical protein AAF340_08125 [Pseudomonadota bacterium]
MFRFLFGKKPEEAVVKETQRETVERALGEVNEILGAMAVKAKIAVNLETGLLEIDLPEQMPDEALALPKPEEAKAEAPKKEANDDAKPAEAAKEDAKSDDAAPKPETEEAKSEKAAA